MHTNRSDNSDILMEIFGIIIKLSSHSWIEAKTLYSVFHNISQYLQTPYQCRKHRCTTVAPPAAHTWVHANLITQYTPSSVKYTKQVEILKI